MKEDMVNIVKKDKKKLLLLTALAFLAVFLLILGDRLSAGNDSSSEPTETVAAVSSSDIASELGDVLSRIDGVGEVKVIIRWDGSGEDVYAYNEETSSVTEQEGASETSIRKEMVLLDGDSAPVVISHKEPNIEGVLVVAEGAADDFVRGVLIDAVASCLHIGKNRINVTAMEVD